jgi:hypothetical protein
LGLLLPACRWLHTYDAGERCMAGADVAALCRLAAPQLRCIALLAPTSGPRSVEAGADWRLIHGPTASPAPRWP